MSALQPSTRPDHNRFKLTPADTELDRARNRVWRQLAETIAELERAQQKLATLDMTNSIHLNLALSVEWQLANACRSIVAITRSHRSYQSGPIVLKSTPAALA